MRRWWMMAAFLVVLGMTLPVQAFEQTFKDPDGDTALAQIVSCNDCKAGVGKNCFDGSEKGWLNAQPCGKCLMESNFGGAIRYPYDLHITGTLVDAAGQPIKERFVKMFLPNGWGVRTRTGEDGKFRMTMGATGERKRKEPLMIDLGTHVDGTKDDGDQQFALYMLGERYKPCAPDTVIEDSAKKQPAKKGAAKKAEKPAAK